MSEPENGRKAHLGVRPEHLALGGDPKGRIEAPVEMVEPMGSDTLAWVRAGASSISIRLGGEARVNVGDRLAFHAPPNRLNLFDGATGPA